MFISVVVFTCSY